MQELVYPRGVMSDAPNLNGVWDSVLSVSGFTSVPGSFIAGATVTSKTDALWDPITGLSYRYVGSAPFPVTVAPMSAPDSNWVKAVALQNFMVGNDPAGGPYDFSELSDALKYIAKARAGYNRINGNTTFRVTVPAGTHTFGPLNIRGESFQDVQIWGAGSTASVVSCIPNNITDGIWCTLRFTGFADIAGIRFQWAPSVTGTTNTSIVCQRWYGSGAPPWGSLPTSNFFDMLGCTMGRMQDLLMVGDLTGAGVRLGAALNIQCCVVNQLNGVTGRNLRDFLVAYNGSVIGSGYDTISVTQGYNFIVNHESTVRLRNVAASAFALTNVVCPGSVFIDTMRGHTSIVGGTGLVARFDTLFLMSNGWISSDTPASQYGTYNKIQESFGDGNTLSTLLTIRDPDILLSNNRIIKSTIGVSDMNSVSRRLGVVQYVGTGTTQNITIPDMAVQLWVRDKASNGTSTLILNQVLTNAGGTQALWFNPATSQLTLYGTANGFNASAGQYEIVWSK